MWNVTLKDSIKSGTIKVRVVFSVLQLNLILKSFKPIFYQICDLLWRKREQVRVTSYSLSRNQHCRLFLSEYSHSGQSYLEAVELPFNNQGLP